MNSTTESEDQKLVNQGSSATHTRIDGPYAKYVLGVLFVMSIFNLIDRQILSILAEAIKADLSLSDGDMGFLFGTAFAVFYVVFGIPMGRLADSWVRTKQISLSVGFWSVMTALSGMARSFVPLAACRFGVGIGEAGASPAAISLLYDYFSPKVRTTVLGIFSSGTSIGGGIGLFLGGAILSAWGNAWPDPSLAPFGLKGWQVAFMVVGLPGLLLSLLIWTLKEPIRGQGEGLAKVVSANPLPPSVTANPFRTLVLEMLPMLPGINLWLLRREGASSKAQWLNMGMGLSIILATTGLIQATGDFRQWLAMAVGLYCVLSWGQVLACRDPVCFGLILRCKALPYLYLFIGLQAFGNAAVSFWMVPWFQRHFEVSAVEVGTVIGLSFAGGGLIGMVLGGMLADRLRRNTQRGKLYVAFGAAALWLLAALCMLSTEQIHAAYVFAFISIFAGGLIAAPVGSTVTDLMIPRTRAIAMSLYIMTANFMGFALGPYVVGLLSDVFTASGMASSEALRQAMFLGLAPHIVAIGFLLLAIKHIVADEDSRLDRARALGEKI